MGYRARTASPTARSPTFARGELTHFAGIKTVLKVPYVENVREVDKYDPPILGIPFDCGTPYWSGTRFAPKASAASRLPTVFRNPGLADIDPD
jgi:arginase family enzyme